MTTIERESLDYYSFDKVFSYNATYNFIVGARGLGKTYGAKKYAIKNAIVRGEEFIYLRRFKTELRSFRTFFADIGSEFPHHDFRVVGWSAQLAPVETRGVKGREWTTIGYAVALSNAATQKSVAFPKVTTIIFDEFIIEKGGALRYLPNEDKAFNDLYSTVDRWKDKTRVLFLANALSVTNPYFLAYNILPSNDPGDEFIKRGGGFIVAHFPDSEKFKTGVEMTRFGRFIKDSDYADYSIGSQFADNHPRMIMEKNSNAKYYFSVETRSGTFSVWCDFSVPTYFVQEKLPKEQAIYTVVDEWMEPGKRILTYSDKRRQILRSAYTRGLIYFDSPKARNAFIELFKR